jgi:hypothetical protein
MRLPQDVKAITGITTPVKFTGGGTATGLRFRLVSGPLLYAGSVYFFQVGS